MNAWWNEDIKIAMRLAGDTLEDDIKFLMQSVNHYWTLDTRVPVFFLIEVKNQLFFKKPRTIYYFLRITPVNKLNIYFKIGNSRCFHIHPCGSLIETGQFKDHRNSLIQHNSYNVLCALSRAMINNNMYSTASVYDANVLNLDTTDYDIIRRVSEGVVDLLYTTFGFDYSSLSAYYQHVTEPNMARIMYISDSFSDLIDPKQARFLAKVARRYRDLVSLEELDHRDPYPFYNYDCWKKVLSFCEHRAKETWRF